MFPIFKLRSPTGLLSSFPVVLVIEVVLIVVAVFGFVISIPLQDGVVPGTV
jgi:hypothetical protein